MRTSGVWAPVIKPDGTLDYTSWNFHIQSKNKLREMIDKDPDCTGSHLLLINEMEFDERLALTEPGEEPIPNEMFIEKMLEDYLKAFNSYNPGIIETKIKNKAISFFKALDKNDIAYYERLMSFITYFVMNWERYQDINGDYTEDLLSLRSWWKEDSESRQRTSHWIDWGFKFILKRYPKNQFYFKSINHILQFIYLNHQNWVIDPRVYPENWFGEGRGKEVNALFGNVF